MPELPILHTYFRSSAAWRVRIALNLKGITYQPVFRHLRREEHKAVEHLALNPTGLLPTLELEGGVAIAQSLAIVEYLDETHRAPPLLPADALGRARVRALALAIACDIHPLNNLRVLDHLRGEFGADDATVNAWVGHWIATGFAAMERQLAMAPQTGTYCHGDQVTLADLCLIPQVGGAKRFGVDLQPYPTIRRIDAACAEIEAFRSARPEHQPDAE